MKEIQLTQGKVALVDDADYEYLMRWKWQAHKGRETDSWYAVRRSGKQMHQQLLSLSNGLEVDHKNGDGLNNQRDNLRPCTHVQNMQNRKLNHNNVCGYKGVGWRPRFKTYRARINVFGKSLYLGQYKKAIDAAVAYDQAAQMYYGEFARLNFSYDSACYI